MIKKIFYVVSLLVTVCFVGALGYYFYLKNVKNYSVVPNNVYIELMNLNPAFLAGERLFKENNPKGAIEEYERALLFARSKSEEAQIKNKIATAKVVSGDTLGAIETSKEVAANEAYGGISRAYAVLFMGKLLFNPRLSLEKNSIKEAIFKDEPYKGFASTTDDSVTYRNLFDYSSSIYPLAPSELRSAHWYADAVFDLKQKPSLSAVDKEKIKEYLQIISQKVELADADIARVREIENENKVLPDTFITKALLNTRVLWAGEAYGGMVSPESVYEEALNYTRLKKMVGGEASIRYGYAVYLAHQYGGDKEAEIKVLLNDFYNSERFTGASIMSLFKFGKTIDVVSNKNIRLLAGIDSGFKEFLQKNGWKF